MQPRIYTYKITFEEVPYYYYGSKKEKYFNQEYWGSPVTNKWCWELYTPKKQILEFFDYTDEGYEECRKVEDRLIKPVLNDPWCLNTHYGGIYSLEINRKVGKKMKELGKGVHSFSIHQRKENGRKGGKKGGNKNKENKTGFCGRSKEQMSEHGKIGGKIAGQLTYELGIGIHGLTKEQLKKCGEKGGKMGSKEDKSKAGKIGGKNTSSQKWMCLETGFITTPGALGKYQKVRGIDKTKRVRLE